MTSIWACPSSSRTFCPCRNEIGSTAHRADLAKRTPSVFVEGRKISAKLAPIAQGDGSRFEQIIQEPGGNDLVRIAGQRISIDPFRTHEHAGRHIDAVYDAFTRGNIRRNGNTKLGSCILVQREPVDFRQHFPQHLRRETGARFHVGKHALAVARVAVENLEVGV